MLSRRDLLRRGAVIAGPALILGRVPGGWATAAIARDVECLRDHARRVYSTLRQQFEASNNYWQLGNCFDTMTDCLRILGPSTDPGLAKLALRRYEATTGAWYDDFAWWAIASAKAYDPAFDKVFRGYAESFTGIAQGCWSVLDLGMNDGVHNGAPQVYANRDNRSLFIHPPTVPHYWVKPRFDTGRGSGLHGVWQKDIFANKRAKPNWTGPAEVAPNPSIPSADNILGPYQTTVVNALYFLLAVRLEQARSRHPGIPPAALQLRDQYGFLRAWMGHDPARPIEREKSLLSEEFHDGTALVRERVSTYAKRNGVYPRVENWDRRTSWGGDQGLMINALAAYHRMRPDPVIPRLLRKLLLGYARHEVDRHGVPQPYYPITHNKLAEWDASDYSCGSGVFMRGLLQAARVGGNPVREVVERREFQAFLRSALAWAQTAPTGDLFSSLNVLATLLVGIELLRR